MEITTLNSLVAGGSVSFLANGLKIITEADWVVSGENRLSYTTLIRLIECCREYHWNKDIRTKSQDDFVDSITKSLSIAFYRALIVGTTIAIRYEIVNVRDKGYEAKFSIFNTQGELCAECNMVSIFFDPEQMMPTPPPGSVVQALKSLLISEPTL